MPLLEVLDLDVLPKRMDSTVQCEDVHLRKLRKLCIPLDGRAFQFVQSIRLPSNTNIRFHASYRDSPTDDDIKSILRPLLDELSIYAMSYIYPAALIRPHTHEYENQEGQYQFWTIPAAQDRATAPSIWRAVKLLPPRLEFPSTLDSPLLTKILPILDLSSVAMLEVHGDVEDTRRWSLAFASAENVTTLRIGDSCAFALGAILAGWTSTEPLHDTAKPGSGSRGTSFDWLGFSESAEAVTTASSELPSSLPLFPKLREIQIFAVDFPSEGGPGIRWRHHRHYGYSHRSSFNASVRNRLPCGMDAKGLAKGLQMRTACGAAKIMRLTFEESRCPDRGHLRALIDGVVDELWWDGKLLTREDYQDVGGTDAVTPD